MKRLNPETKQPFKYGEIRADGYVFYAYAKTKPLRPDGTYRESWLSPESMEKANEKNRQYYWNNPEKEKEKRKEYYFKNYEKINEKRKERYRNNPEKEREQNRLWKKNNPHKRTKHDAKRRVAKIQAGTKYFKDLYKDEVAAYYMFAKVLEKLMGEKMHVDHVIPLLGKNVSGLHIPANLQIITATANMKKGNKYE